MTRAFCTSITHDITFEEISDLLITAFEGGSNYWIESIQYVDPPTVDFHPDSSYPGEKHNRYAYVPLCDGGAMLIKGDGVSGWKTLNKEAISRGLGLMEKLEWAQRHLVNIVNDNADAETADVFLQLCLFGELVYS